MAWGEKFEEALVFAAQLHRDQKRKVSGVPYITHLLAVAALVGENGGTETEVIAALLHDAIEDQGGSATRAHIRARFGEEVVAMVDGCTDADSTPKPPWRPRKEAYIAHLPQASTSVRLISLADKTHNLRCLLTDLRQFGDEVWLRFAGRKEGTIWFYKTLLNVYMQGEPSPLRDEYQRLVESLGEWE